VIELGVKPLSSAVTRTMFDGAAAGAEVAPGPAALDDES
jgi:hypothetical protein